MKPILKNIKSCSIYFITFGAVLVCLGFILILWSKADSHLWINQYHSPTFDTIFCTLTLAGTGLSIAITAVILLFIKFRHTIALLIGYLFAIGIVQLFKHVLLSGMYRPIKYFEEQGIDIYYIEGIKNKTLKGFPSGHTTEIFFVITFIALLIGNKSYNLLLLLVALLVGFSRIYLSQHFIQDVFGGAILGTLCALISYTYFQKYEANEGWLNKSILTR